jgi:predicted RNA methylase
VLGAAMSAAQLLPGMEGEGRRRDLSQFYTPKWLADRVANWACRHSVPKWVLEPAAGRGALVAAIKRTAPSVCVSAWDIDPANCEALAKVTDRTRDLVWCGDFLLAQYDAPSDLALMNPPYEDNQDVAFIEHSLEHSARVVGIFQARIVHSAGRSEFWRWTDIQRMAFLSERPHFGGPHSAKTDFVVHELVRRKLARKQGEATPAAVEWWSR